MGRLLALAGIFALGGCGAGPLLGTRAEAGAGIECAPFARQMSGIQLYGDAASWWDQATSRYERRSDPVEGGVLVFRRSGRLPSGHVSVVVGLVSGREIHVTQANWVHGRITRDEPVIDVSPGNDWSSVRVWWAPANAIGSTTYPTFGFVAPTAARPGPDVMATLQPR